MPSMTTIYRSIVMIVAGVLVVKGWQLYGPSNEQTKTIALAALEKAKAAWNGSAEDATGSTAAVVDPRPTTAPEVTETQPVVSAPVQPAPLLVPLESAVENRLSTAGEALSTAQTPSTLELNSKLELGSKEVITLLARLHELGGANAQVMPWGSSGQFYRCCCRANLAESSPMARHFEAVAEAPIAAVEQVVAKVEAWRTEQRNLPQ
jgi:hypothetical protein